MPAKIIPFPRFMQRHLTLSRGRQVAHALEQAREWDTAEGIHLVGTAEPGLTAANADARRESQQKALRIVQEVQQEWNDRHHPAQSVHGERSPHFWATLPLPQPQQRETPLTVARRLMHMLLSDAKTA